MKKELKIPKFQNKTGFHVTFKRGNKFGLTKCPHRPGCLVAFGHLQPLWELLFWTLLSSADSSRILISQTLFWNTENTGQKLDAKSFQGEISTFLPQEKLVSIYRTNTLPKNRDWRLAGLQHLLLWKFLILYCCSDVVHHCIQQTSTELILSHSLSARCCGFKAH